MVGMLNRDDYPAAKQTKYGGVVFRSRWEAKLAKSFTRMEWFWVYEPRVPGLRGWLPDFSITDGKRYLLIEAKPIRFTDRYANSGEHFGVNAIRKEPEIQKVLRAIPSKGSLFDVAVVGLPSRNSTLFGIMVHHGNGAPMSPIRFAMEPPQVGGMGLIVEDPFTKWHLFKANNPNYPERDRPEYVTKALMERRTSNGFPMNGIHSLTSLPYNLRPAFEYSNMGVAEWLLSQKIDEEDE